MKKTNQCYGCLFYKEAFMDICRYYNTPLEPAPFSCKEKCYNCLTTEEAIKLVDRREEEKYNSKEERK